MSCRAAFVVPALAAACGWTAPEDQLLEAFFRAARTFDSAQLAGVSTMRLDPRQLASVDRFAIERIDGESRRPLARPQDDELAIISLTPLGQPDVSLQDSTVEIVEKQATVRASVLEPEGGRADREMTMTLSRAISRRGDHGYDGRWIVTAVTAR